MDLHADLVETLGATPMTVTVDAIEDYLNANARPLDLAFYRFHFVKESAEAVVEALRSFQNEDGGFGHGIEPDLGMPDSSALATSVAFQYLADIGIDNSEPIVRRGMDYLRESYLAVKSGWDIIGQESNDHPHAPWWDYQAAKAGFGWGNPSAELLGYFYKFSGSRAREELMTTATAKAVERVEQLALNQNADFHELFCYVGLPAAVDQPLRSTLRDLLVPLVSAAVSRNPDDWEKYGATPLTFAARPGSTFAHLFDEALIDANLDFVEASISIDHWEPTWDWGDTYPDDWPRARQDWIGKITVDNMILLRSYGRI
jgi:hypothetical protein